MLFSYYVEVSINNEQKIERIMEKVTLVFRTKQYQVLIYYYTG